MGKSKYSLSREQRIDNKIKKQLYEQQLISILKTEKQSANSLKRNIESYFEKNVKISKPNQTNIDFNFKAFSTANLINEREAYKNILLILEKEKCYKVFENEIYMDAFYKIALHYKSIIRPILNWKKPSYNPEKQFSGLVKYLFTKYETPVFLISAWFSNNYSHINWFIEIGNGKSVSKLNHLPISLTKRMAHEFLQAPEYCSVPEALRYAQTIALGGDEHLAFYLNASCLGRNEFENDDFWSTVIHFFANADDFNTNHLETMVDYIYSQKAINPSFSMKGRTIDALLRQTLEWHAEISSDRNAVNSVIWEPSGISEFDLHEEKNGNFIIYRIRELLSSRQLKVEGQKMHHCVNTYVQKCRTRRSSIFSLTVDTIFDAGLKRAVTLEVNLSNRTILQAKRKLNERINEKDREIINTWAFQEKLIVLKGL